MPIAIPYGALGLLCLVYVLLRLPDAGSRSAEQAIPVWPGLFSGLKHLLFFPIGAPRLDWVCLRSFSREAQSFDDVLAATTPGHRALGLVLDIASPSARNPMAYVSFPVWYQAEKSGFVDFNFAYFPTQVVRYRDGKKPPDDYRYFFVRSTGPLPAKLFPAGACEPVLRKSSGSWSVFENGKC